MEPLQVSRENFPMRTVTVEGMIPMEPKLDNYEIYYHEDVPYIERGGRTLRLQIIGPIGAESSLPCIVYIPGSAFHEQNVKERMPQLSYFAQRGFVVAALEYRGSECAIFPAQALDAKAGVHFMREHAKEYGIHPELVRPTIIANHVQENRELPPILMLHGTNDELVPFGQGCQLYEALRTAGKDATFYQVLGAHHGGREFWTKEVLDIEEGFMRRLCEV